MCYSYSDIAYSKKFVAATNFNLGTPQQNKISSFTNLMIVSAAACQIQSNSLYQSANLVPTNFQAAFSLQQLFPACSSVPFTYFNLTQVLSVASPECLSALGELFCCILCFDNVLDDYVGINDFSLTASIFSGFLNSPAFTLQCGSSPKFVVNSACTEFSLFSWNDFTNSLDCSSITQPPSYSVVFNVTIPFSVVPYVLSAVVDTFFQINSLPLPFTDTSTFNNDGSITTILYFYTSADATTVQNAFNSKFSNFVLGTLSGSVVSVAPGGSYPSSPSSTPSSPSSPSWSLVFSVLSLMLPCIVLFFQ